VECPGSRCWKEHEAYLAKEYSLLPHAGHSEIENFNYTQKKVIKIIYFNMENSMSLFYNLILLSNEHLIS
jgi:hypothetical protein